jgi:hypothetical protein
LFLSVNSGRTAWAQARKVRLASNLLAGQYFIVNPA